MIYTAAKMLYSNWKSLANKDRKEIAWALGNSEERKKIIKPEMIGEQ